MAVVCVLFTACSKDQTQSSKAMEWTYEIIEPENIMYEGASIGWLSKFSFRANGKESNIVMTCENYDVLTFSDSSDTYDCGWATLTVEANQLKIHFPYYVSDAPEVYEEITLTGYKGKRKANTIICLSRTFDEGPVVPEPETVPEKAKFKMKQAGFTPLMHLDSQLPAPLDLLTFRITDINDYYVPIGFPEFTQHYDSIVWSADGFPHTFKIYENSATAGGAETKFMAQWSSYFFKSGTIKNHLKGYRHGKVQYETSLNVVLFERDFLGLEWGLVVFQNSEDPKTYCLLNTDYEYRVYDITLKNNASFSKIIPVNHKQLSNSDFVPLTAKAIKSLMEENVGIGRNANGKEELFKCLPEKGVEAELYWENETTRMLMLHRLPDDSNEYIKEKYYLHVEPK